MATTSEVAAYLLAYEAWRGAVERWHAQVQHITQGSAYERTAFQELTDDVDRLHKDWMEKSKPLISGTIRR